MNLLDMATIINFTAAQVASVDAEVIIDSLNSINPISRRLLPPAGRPAAPCQRHLPGPPINNPWRPFSLLPIFFFFVVVVFSGLCSLIDLDSVVYSCPCLYGFFYSCDGCDYYDLRLNFGHFGVSYCRHSIAIEPSTPRSSPRLIHSRLV